MSLGRVTAALASVNNENSVSLANLNLDFTLVKLEAPAEYNGLGATISRKRKVDAEEGVLHKTARKLGALFAGLLPSTDHLFRAYGKRVSEISSMPDINPPAGSDGGGIFASHLGADTTSIWAAVTSGGPSISAHLLGCMLARLFTSPEAVSVWVELVQKRKEAIRGIQRETLYSQEQTLDCVAAQQDISRADLAKWDASARAWLQSADQAKQLQHKQTMLILNNTSVPVNNEPETYTSVIKAWTVALEAMDSLVRGIPQRVQDGAALLAISSWHLYPDMVVYGGPEVEVKQKDSLFEPAALLTLGLQHLRESNKSVYWSLPLAHLQYYGHPIRASRTAGQENSRVSYHQFPYILLGCLFGGWKDFAITNEQGLIWVQRVGRILKLPTTQDFVDDAEKDSNPAWLHYTKNIWGQARRLSPTSEENPSWPSWLNYLIAAAVQLRDGEGSESKAANQLINLGRRRSSFLHAISAPPPLFGLSQFSVLLSVLKSDLQRVQLLRSVCEQRKLEGRQFLISYKSSTKEPRTEYASLVPFERQPQKRMLNGSLKGPQLSSSKYIRWITLSTSQLKLCVKWGEELNNIENLIITLRKLEEIEHGVELSIGTSESILEDGLDQDQEITRFRRKRLADIKELKEVLIVTKRRQSINEIGEVCLPVVEWAIDPDHSFYETRLIFSLESDFVEAAKDLLEKFATARSHVSSVTMSKVFYAGNPDLAAIYSIAAGAAPQGVGVDPLRCALKSLILESKHVEKLFAPDNFNTEALCHHFSHISELGQPAEDEIRNLGACAMMADIYKLLPGATISTLIVNQSLSRAKWIPGSYQRIGMPSSSIIDSNLTLPQAFACVAMFESGTCNLDPSTLSEAFAMSSGNSLYVAGTLLCDPYEQPKTTELRRVIGNVGRAGITFLICPPEVKTREPNPEKWMAINHNAFDGNPENHFRQTSIHLSFTEYEIPLITEDNPRHIIDRAVILVETLVSVFDGGTWVAEVDILKAFRSNVLRVVHDPRHSESPITIKDEAQKQLDYKDALLEYVELAATSVENWDELIEAPSTGAIAIRAHKNWLARLAATALCVKYDFIPIVLPEEPCWSCCADTIFGSGFEKLAFIF